MGIGASLTTFSPGSTIQSSQVNGNFTSLNNSGLSNDSGSISTSGGGVITAAGFVTSSGDNISISTSGKLQFGSNNVMYVETATGFLDLQAYGAGGKVVFKDSSGNSIAAINPSSHALQLVDNSAVYHDIIYANTGSAETYFQMLGGGKMRFKDSGGNDIASLDASGNWRTKGTQTASVTP